MRYRPVVLAILDGWGLGSGSAGNAPALARTPTLDRLMAERPSARLSASGSAVGLPEGQMGNSEVGHTTIGAGRVIWMDLPRIDRAIADGSFAANPALARFAERLRGSGGTAHLLGVASPGGVHAHQDHILAAARVLAAQGIPLAIHAFTDGRDVAPRSAAGQIAALEAALPVGARIASICGRYFAMDRDRRWDRVKRATDLVLHGEGHRAPDAAAAIRAAYARGETDEFISPTRLDAYAAPADGDGLFCANFRADRAREILGALADPEFAAYDPGPRPAFAARLGMVEYSDHLSGIFETMFPAEPIRNTLGEWVAAHGLRQFRLAETEKYPHVTFFLNGGREDPFPGEERRMAPSPKVATYDLAPEMAAAEVTEHLVGAIAAGYDLIVVNYANPDMVGHTGDLEAAIRACEAVDRGLGIALAALERTGGAMIVTADHGNAETMIDPATGGPHTAHTLNRVPAVLVTEGGENARLGLADGGLADLAPTLLDLMGLAVPAEMTGRSLIERGE
jgi:2,3-bisphosphoglycerate-independent phosphoglycerate mutase